MTEGIHQGDVREWLAGLPDESVHCAITSPPYWGLRDYQLDPRIWGGSDVCEHEWGDELVGRMDKRTPEDRAKHSKSTLTVSANAAQTARYISQSGDASQGSFCSLCGAWRGDLGLEPTPELYIEHMVSVFRDLRRVLRSDGTVWLNIGDSYFGDSPQRDKAWNKAEHGTWDPAMTASRGGKRRSAAKSGSLKPKDLCMIPARLALALQADGWWIRSQIVWAKGISFCPSYSGSVMPESCRDRPTSAYEMVYLLTKNERYHYDADAVREQHQNTDWQNDMSRPATSGWGEQAGKSGVLGGGNTGLAEDGRKYNPAGRNLRNVWTITPQPMAWEMCAACKRVYSPAEFRRQPQSLCHRICKCGETQGWLSHFATFPEKLVAPMIQAGCPAKVCAECGAPWVREVEKSGGSTGKGWHDHSADSVAGQSQKHHFDMADYRRDTLGFHPTCECGGDTEPGLVAEPFCGSGTVPLAAEKFNRRWIAAELNADYVTLATERIRRAQQQSQLDLK